MEGKPIKMAPSTKATSTRTKDKDGVSYLILMEAAIRVSSTNINSVAMDLTYTRTAAPMLAIGAIIKGMVKVLNRMLAGIATLDNM